MWTSRTRSRSIQNSDYCANCGRPIDGPEQNFCPVCGQRTPVHRINWHFLGHELQHGIFHVDGGIIYSLRQLLTRPGHTIREYIRGRRVPHFKPVLMIMILGAVVTVLSKYLLESGGLIPTSLLTINEGRIGTAAALTVLFGPIGLLKRGLDISVPAGQTLTATVDASTELATPYSLVRGVGRSSGFGRLRPTFSFWRDRLCVRVAGGADLVAQGAGGLTGGRRKVLTVRCVQNRAR